MSILNHEDLLTLKKKAEQVNAAFLVIGFEVYRGEDETTTLPVIYTDIPISMNNINFIQEA